MSRKRCGCSRPAALVLVVPAALATAAAARTRDDAINACVKKDGKVRIDRRRRVVQEERAVVTWNTCGPAARPGLRARPYPSAPAGPAGPTGPTGSTGGAGPTAGDRAGGSTGATGPRGDRAGGAA